MISVVRLGVALLVATAPFLILGAGSAGASPSGWIGGDEVPAEYSFTETDSSIQLPSGQQFTITLPSNPTTGYSWQLAEPVDESVLVQVGSSYVPTPRPVGGPPIVGSGGEEVWSFSSISDGKATISMKYVRPWEKVVPAVRTAVFEVTVGETSSGAVEPKCGEPADASPSDQVPGDEARSTFSLDRVDALRTVAVNARADSTKYPNGWNRSVVDPTGLLASFDSLQLRSGYSLIGYQYVEGGNGNGFVWAVPEGTTVLDPEELQPQGPGMARIPRPDGAVPVMQAIEGDGSPWSYMSASILGREMREFGARWHGISWGTQRILDADPLDPSASVPTGGYPGPTLDPAEWKWSEPKPVDWKPTVVVEKDRVTVVFYTFTAFQNQMIERHTDVYQLGSYSFNSTDETVAIGPGGFVF